MIMLNRLLLLCLLALVACTEESGMEDKPDVQRPEIVLRSTTPVAKEGIICETTESKVITVSTGSDILLDLEFLDDEELSQYKIDIHNNFDCHSHGRAAPWQLLEIRDIEGTQVIINEVLSVPTDALAGNYHLQILCLDKAGNEAEPVIYSMTLENAIDSITPQFTLTEPSDGGISVAKGSEVRFKGEVTDNHSLDAGKIEIHYTDPDGTEYFPLQEFFPEGQGEEALFDLIFKVPVFAMSGKHEFSIKVYDRYNNFVEKIIDIEFT